VSVTLEIILPTKKRWLSVPDANRNGVGAMSGVETCPDYSEYFPSNSPAGPCPRCLLRLGAAIALDPNASESHAGAAPLGTAMARVHLRESSDDAPLIRPAPVEGHGHPDASTRYQLLGELARGGMGAIFQGRNLYLGRDLAMKVMREEHCD